MITPRHIRLFPTRGLKAFQRTILTLVSDADPWTARRMAVLVPSGAAGQQLRYTIEDDMVEGARGPGVRVVPLLLTREGWYQEMHDRSGEVIPVLAPTERHVLMLAAARRAAQDEAPPFKLRAGLIPAVISFYDELVRHRRSVDAFERLITADLEPSLELDRGARRLHRQTTFLVSTFRRYESLLAERRRLDEHGVRRSVIAGDPVDPLTKIVVTLPDHVVDPAGLWPADYDLLTRLPGLERIDVVATDRVLSAGFHDRLVELLPGIECQPGSVEEELPPVVVTPEDEERSHFVWRDREEELIAVIRGVKSRPDLDAGALDPGLPRADPSPDRRVGVVFQRPLPYLYLARQLFGQANVAFEAFDALPLAAEPYAAALDLVCSFVTTGYDRASTIALLRSPHFRFELDGRALDRGSIEDLDRLLRRARFSSGRRALEQLAAGPTEPGRNSDLGDCTNARAAAGLAARLAASLRLLEEDGPPSVLLGVLSEFLARHTIRYQGGVVGVVEREGRARVAVWNAIDDLRNAHHELDDAPISFVEVVSVLRRRIESQVFESRAGSGGVHLVDTQAAPYGCFHDLFIIGLVDGDWPERHGRNIFFPSSLLVPLGWPRERDVMRAERARFGDLVGLARDRVWLSTVSLEGDAIVMPSSLLEDGFAADMVRAPTSVDSTTCVTREDAIAFASPDRGSLPEPAATWFTVRADRGDRSAHRFRGFVGRREPVAYAVRALEEYLECPFKYFAKRVLRLGEEDADERSTEAQRRGLLLHRVFELFFRDWGEGGTRSITVANLEQALTAFRRLAETVLEEHSMEDRAITRAWLLGSSAAAGLADRLFALEASRPAEVVQRLTEFRVDGEFLIGAGEVQRRVRLRGVADRVDLFSDGTFRVLDYKSNRAPERSRSLQLPLYARCLEQQLEPHEGRPWRVGEAAFVAFGDPRFYLPLSGGSLSARLDAGERRAVTVLQDIENGDYPVRPVELYRCSFCAYPTVCRKDYVGDE